MKNFFRLFKYLREYKFLLVVIVISTIFAALLNVSNIALLKPVLEVFFGEVKDKQANKVELTECPNGEVHQVFVIKDTEKLSNIQPGEEYTYCPFGAPHKIIPHKKPEGAIDKAQAEIEKELKTSFLNKSRFLQPLAQLYDKAKQKKHEIQIKFYGYIQQGRQLYLLLILGLVILAIEILKFVFIFLSQYLSNYVGYNIVQKLRSQLYEHILKQDMTFFHRRTTGELMSRISGDVGGVREMLMLMFDDTLQAPINMIFIIGFMIYINWQLTLLLFIFGPLTVIPIRFFGKKTRVFTRKAREKTADISAAMQEIISNIVIVKAYQMEKYEAAKFNKDTQKYTKYLLRQRRLRVISSPFMDILGTIAVVITMLIGGYFIAEARIMSSSAFFVYLFAMSRLYKPIKKLNDAFGELQKGLAYTERIFEILDTVPTIKDAPDAVPISRLQEKIELVNVWFAYRDERWVLEDINLTIPAGKMVALVGPSGAGKSTMISLLMRLFDPQRGAILFDGVDIRKATVASVREQIGVVLQQSMLFNDTIRNNITCGRKDIPEEIIIEAAIAANAHEFIVQFPEGYDTIAGERGGRLSGGQRQRIAIARAILKDPAILILDEATSSLDTESERKIQEAISRLIKGRTTIVIAHRLSTVMNADLIVVMDKGRIIEIGTHAELICLNGLYSRLCKLQLQPSLASH